MIVKMKFLSISGPRTDIDRVTSRYLSKYEMQTGKCDNGIKNHG